MLYEQRSKGPTGQDVIAAGLVISLVDRLLKTKRTSVNHNRVSKLVPPGRFGEESCERTGGFPLGSKNSDMNENRFSCKRVRERRRKRGKYLVTHF